MEDDLKNPNTLDAIEEANFDSLLCLIPSYFYYSKSQKYTSPFWQKHYDSTGLTKLNNAEKLVRRLQEYKNIPFLLECESKENILELSEELDDNGDYDESPIPPNIKNNVQSEISKPNNKIGNQIKKISNIDPQNRKNIKVNDQKSNLKSKSLKKYSMKTDASNSKNKSIKDSANSESIESDPIRSNSKSIEKNVNGNGLRRIHIGELSLSKIIGIDFSHRNIKSFQNVFKKDSTCTLKDNPELEAKDEKKKFERKNQLKKRLVNEISSKKSDSLKNTNDKNTSKYRKLDEATKKDVFPNSSHPPDVIPEPQKNDLDSKYHFSKISSTKDITLKDLGRRKNPTLTEQLKNVQSEKETLSNLDEKESLKKKHEMAWDKALKKVDGEKVFDNEKKIKKRINKRIKDKEKSRKEWKSREKKVKKDKKERDEKRRKNIADRLQNIRDIRDRKILKKQLKNSS